MTRPRLWFCHLLLCALLAAAPAWAQQQAPTSEEARTQEARAAWQTAAAAATRGPSDVPLLDEARLQLSRNMLFVPPLQATRLLRAWGNKVSQDPLGLIIGTRDEDEWAIVLRFVKEGYIKDDDARDWNASEMLKNIREGNDEANKDRVSRGFPEIEIIGWIAPPAYDSDTHRLVSSLAIRHKGAAEDVVQGVNYVTYALGRNGYFSLDMLTNRTNVAHDRTSAALVLSNLDYNEGHRYADFNAGTDHVAEYGLAALVGVVAAKKLGLLALAGAFALKFAKVGAVIVALAGAAAARIFKRKPKPNSDVA